jgi:hypothetical protein
MTPASATVLRHSPLHFTYGAKVTSLTLAMAMGARHQRVGNANQWLARSMGLPVGEAVRVDKSISAFTCAVCVFV